MTYACPAWQFTADTRVLKVQCLQNQVFSLSLVTLKSHADPRITRDSQNSVRMSIWFDYQIMQAASRSHRKIRKCNCWQHRTRRSHTQKL